MSDKERMSILARIESGELDPEQGAELLAELGKESKTEASDKNETMQVLEMVESGELSPDEAVNRFEEEASNSDGCHGVGKLLDVQHFAIGRHELLVLLQFCAPLSGCSGYCPSVGQPQ